MKNDDTSGNASSMAPEHRRKHARLRQVRDDRLQGLNSVGAGFSLAWIAFFITCMFVCTNLPNTAFATRFLANERIVWTLGGSFVAALVLAMWVRALFERFGVGGRSNQAPR